jgi:hypothetical protein
MFRSNFFHFRWVENIVEDQNFVFKNHDGSLAKYYVLGKSNKTSLPKGGMTIATFLIKEDKFFNSIGKEPQENFNIVWSILRCSSKERYDKKKARMVCGEKAIAGAGVLISKNYDYETVKKILKKISLKLAEVVETTHHALRAQGRFMTNQLMKAVKGSFNIDAYVEAGCKTVDNAVTVSPLQTNGGTSL